MSSIKPVSSQKVCTAHLTVVAVVEGTTRGHNPLHLLQHGAVQAMLVGLELVCQVGVVLLEGSLECRVGCSVKGIVGNRNAHVPELASSL